ncbi:hypothetical protein P7H31_05585 [Enterococcus asini]|uniref:hypothetical protein n=1 Tax=Enterococcus asini TaxID=57732 RepID=UPI001386B91A|nr:hypothetical protein [Enterococcus asini]MDT2763777.1 hypothetical protein [Enterococcus asini]
MSELTESIQALSTSQALLKEFAKNMEKDRTFGKEAYQEKINDIRDYANGLAIVTYLVPAQNQTVFGDVSLQEILRTQLGQIQNVIHALRTPEGASEAEATYDLKESDVRRMVSSLQGMIEMNNLMRKEEDVVFPAKYEEAQFKEKPVATSEKKGFFQKLFGK